MPGTNAGTGCPLHFRCAKCRLTGSRTWPRGSSLRVKLTGRTKPMKTNRNARMSNTLYEYHCTDCSHLGWSRHYELDEKAKILTAEAKGVQRFTR